MPDGSGKPIPPPPWGWGDEAPPPTPVLALPAPAKKKDHGKATQKERTARHRERKKRAGPRSLQPAHIDNPGKWRPGRSGNPRVNAGQWKPGQSGNPNPKNAFAPGRSGNPLGVRGATLYKEAQRICRDASPQAAFRMVELMDNEDPRVAYMATNMILERAWGKPKEYDPAADPENQVRIDVARLSDEERATLRQLMQRSVVTPAPESEEEQA